MQKLNYTHITLILGLLLVNTQLFSQDNRSHAILDTAKLTNDVTEEDIETEPNNEKRTIGVLLGIGAAPLNANVGVGYFFSHKFLAYTKFVGAVAPDYYNYSVNLGVNYIHKRGNSLIYIFEFGTLIDGNDRTYNGHSLKGGLGYMFRSSSERTHFGINLSLVLIGESHREAVIVPELEFVLGAAI